MLPHKRRAVAAARREILTRIAAALCGIAGQPHAVRRGRACRRFGKPGGCGSSRRRRQIACRRQIKHAVDAHPLCARQRRCIGNRIKRHRCRIQRRRIVRPHRLRIQRLSVLLQRQQHRIEAPGLQLADRGGQLLADRRLITLSGGVIVDPGAKPRPAQLGHRHGHAGRLAVPALVAAPVAFAVRRSTALGCRGFRLALRRRAFRQKYRERRRKHLQSAERKKPYRHRQCQHTGACQQKRLRGYCPFRA